MIVAITGGTGFVGRRLVSRHLASGDLVRILTRREGVIAGLPDAVRRYQGDIQRDAKELVEFVDGADVLYHCAAELNDESRMHAVHVDGTRHLLEAAHGRIGRWVQLSSVGVYGRTPGGLVTEETPLQPANTYEKTKAESERLVMGAGVRENMPFAILRPSKMFGPDMRPRDLFQLIAVIDSRMFFFIGKPGAIVNYAHVANVVEGLVRCGTHPSAVGRVYNLSDWRTLEEFVSIIACQLGRPAPTIRIPESFARALAWLVCLFPGAPLTRSRITGLTNRTVYANTRIERELGYRHLVTMEQGLHQMVAAWRKDA